MTTVIPKAVSNLRLCAAFKGFATNVLDCIETVSDNFVYIVDDDQLKFSRLATEEEAADSGFTGSNPSADELHLLSIDNKLLKKGTAGGVADCALFNHKNFTLIEFKANAVGASLESIVYTYEKAISQIENTIELLSVRMAKVGIDFKTHIEITPHIIVSQSFPRANAMEMEYAMGFLNRNSLPLSFENSREF